jgi:hypothetical protein
VEGASQGPAGTWRAWGGASSFLQLDDCEKAWNMMAKNLCRAGRRYKWRTGLMHQAFTATSQDAMGARPCMLMHGKLNPA